MEVFVGILSLCIAIASMCYAGYLHIYYHDRIVPLRDAEESRYRENMRKLGVDDDDIDIYLREFYHIEDLKKANRKVRKAVKKYKLS